MTTRVSYSGLNDYQKIGIKKYLGMQTQNESKNWEESSVGFVQIKKNRFTTVGCEKCIVPAYMWRAHSDNLTRWNENIEEVQVDDSE